MFTRLYQKLPVYQKSTRLSTRAYATCKQRNAKQMSPVTSIQPKIILDKDIPIENEIYSLHEKGNLDAKQLIVLGRIAVKASVQHLGSRLDERDLEHVKATYDKIVDALRADSNTNNEFIQSEIHKQRQLYETMILELKQSHNESMQSLKRTYEQYSLESENIITTRSSQITKELVNAKDKEIAILQERIDYLSKQELQLQNRLIDAKDDMKNLQSDFVKTIQDEDILALKSQIATLKGSNFSKGIIGENTIRDILLSTFNNVEVVDKSGVAAESDLHVVRPNDNCFIAIECKNKNQITPSDVDKSIRDIQFLKGKYGKRFIGYIFISLRTTNIPRKGVSFELINEIPTIWYGAQCDNNSWQNSVAHTLPVLIKLIWDVSTHGHHDASVHTEFNSGLLKNTINEILIKIESNQRIISSLQNNIRMLQENNNNVYEKLYSYINAAGINTLPFVNEKENNTQIHSCSSCQKTFSRKGDLTRHSKKCKVD